LRPNLKIEQKGLQNGSSGEHLPSQHQALSSNPQYQREKEDRNYPLLTSLGNNVMNNSIVQWITTTSHHQNKELIKDDKIFSGKNCLSKL
jgi:hypothetical protein